jgi:hypothetical protein
MRALLCFMGFTENERERSDTEDLWWNVMRPLSDPDKLTVYHPRTWSSRTKPLLDQLRRRGVVSTAVYSYSHGQAAAMDFSREAREYGISVDLWLACDPVYRPAWLPRWNALQPLSFRAMIPGAGKIHVPPTVRRVVWCRQRMDLPQGADLVAEDAQRTFIEPPMVLARKHTQIDSDLHWAAVVQKELLAWVNPPRAVPVAEGGEG